MRSSSVNSLVNFKSAAAVTVLSLTLAIVAPTAQAATVRPQRAGRASVTQSDNSVTRVQRAMQRLFNRLLAMALPSDPVPAPTPSAVTNTEQALPTDPWPLP